MDQYDFLSNFRIEIFFAKNTPFNSLKSVRAEHKGDELGTLPTELSTSQFFV